jgi:UV DNA damage endonuclease
VRLGFAVKVLGDGGLPTSDNRRWQSDPHLRWSLEMLHGVLDYCDRHDIRFYRFSAGIAPYATHPDMPQFRGQVEACADRLAALGRRAAEQGLRLSCHPSQYIVLNSEDERVRRSAVADLELQGEIFAAMGLPEESVVVIHVGSVGASPAAGLERFEAGWAQLSDRARSRIVVEHDDRLFGLADVLDLHQRTGARVVFDLHHHRCHDPAGIPEREALERALATWPDDVIPKIHFSSPKLEAEERTKRVGRRVERRLVFPDPRAHADLIDPFDLHRFTRETASGLRDFDVMIEAKAKDLALLRLRDQLAALSR